MLTYDSWLNNWRYFFNLCSRFENTIQFVDDKTDGNGDFINGNTFSNEFAMILLSASVEFENVSKQLCEYFDSNFNTSKADIRQITDCILMYCPNIGSAEVELPHISIQPLKNWKKSPTTNKVDGIDWWTGYTDIKHNRYVNFEEANLRNCIYALASLLVIELYGSQEVDKNSTNQPAKKELSTNLCSYFSFNYLRGLYLLNPKPLP